MEHSRKDLKGKTKMSVSKWEIHRIGLVDFWYYDDEDFYFADGKMLLRGANGSGKSVTMQSFIPLLLDGNKASERLDPFGTKARKIENYLLEENDGREERTAYLYMEFKRKESDTYFTMGLGLRARKNKKMDSWYFAILDGRRIGRDFNLYKDLSDKVSLSKIELRNKLAEGGIVMETQKEYMKFINDRLFGYETVEEYKELIDLLLQLRTPKLSKDFKPTVLNEILSNSLQTLSEDDLRPMSEAIENMDSMKSRLDDLKLSKKAADKIAMAYEHYNKKVLYDKAESFDYVMKDYELYKKKNADYELQEKELDQKKQQAGEQVVILKDEKDVQEKKKKALDANDVTALKEKQLQLEEIVEKQKNDLTNKEKQKEEKKSLRIEAENNLKETQEKVHVAEKEIKENLEELAEIAQNIKFDEFEFVKAELLENIKEKYDFAAHKGEVERLKKEIKKGLELLSDVEKHELDHERLKQEYEKENKATNQLEHEKEQLEAQEIQVKSEFLEKAYKWNKGNQQLVFSDDSMRQISLTVEQFEKNSDFMEISKNVFFEKAKKSELIQKELINATNIYDDAEKKVQEKEIELEQWLSKKDPEPERSQVVLENRLKLTEQKIPYTSFYKVVDFVENISEKQADILEEALLEMGILDALIIPSNYESRVLALDEGVCDKYLFSNSEYVKNAIGDLLCLDADVQDLILNQSITNLIQSIGCVKGSGTFIDEKGNYGIGVIQGTITKKYKAKYIGVKAREKFKKVTIEELQNELSQLKIQLENCRKIVSQWKTAGQILDDEYEKFPKGADIIEAVKLVSDIQDKIYAQNVKIENLTAEIKAVFEKVKELRIEISKVCHQTHLEGKKTIFENAKDTLNEYEKGILQVGHNQREYISILAVIKLCESRIEDIDTDLDNLLYDITNLERNIRNNSAEIENCEKQLQLSNYEEIKAELDYCIKRLKELPDEIENEVKKEVQLNEKLEVLKIEKVKLEEILEKAQKDVMLLKAGVKDELDLGYINLENLRIEASLHKAMEREPSELVNEQKISDKELKFMAERIIEKYAMYKEKPQSEYMQDMQAKFHENLSEMSEYKLQLSTKFIAEDYSEFEGGFKKPDFRRMVILGKYQSKSVEFPKLLLHLAEDIATQEQLITESDREIFEDILVNTISKKIRAKIYKSENWVKNMNILMDGMDTSSGLKLNLKWKYKKSEHEHQLDTKELVELLKKDAQILKDEEFIKLSKHFQSKVEEARRILAESGNTQSFHSIMKDVLDYRQWFEFQLYYKKTGEEKKELTNNAFFTLSGGEKAMAMYVPLFSAVVAKYQGANDDAPKLISLDEAFAGVDETNIRDMFKLMIGLDFQFIINSQILWGDYDTVPKLAVYQLLRPENAKYVTVIPYLWNGKQKVLMTAQDGVKQ